MQHDLGFSEVKNDSDDNNDFVYDKTLHPWQKQAHALLIVLSKQKLLTTDELRRAVENLEPDAYLKFDYYSRWNVGIMAILIERGIISELELHQQLHSSDDIDPVKHMTPKFVQGQTVRVVEEDPRIRWRKPHLRIPGYIHGMSGVIQSYVGYFEDPYLLAFRVGNVKFPKMHLYRVNFPLHDIQYNTYYSKSSIYEKGVDKNASVTVDVYEIWLKDSHYSILQGVEQKGKQQLQKSDEANQKRIKTSDSSNADGSVQHHQQYQYQQYARGHEYGDHSRNDINQPHSHPQIQVVDESQDHDHSHSDVSDHSHTFEGRQAIEQRAVDLEGEDNVGRLIGDILLTILQSKGLISVEELRAVEDSLDMAGQKLLGADIVVRCWVDSDFKRRLLANPNKTAFDELGVNTSNANAPTQLVCLENTATTHNVVVCTLCSCYPTSLLGVSPSFYRSRSYRSRCVQNPRLFLSQHFNTVISEDRQIVVSDSTADCRYLVIPLRPHNTENWTENQLKSIVTRDSMIGVTEINT